MTEKTTATHDVAADAEKLRKLHVPGDPLVLANVWDPPSARLVEAAGMRAIATSSNAIAPLNGYEDHGQIPADVSFAAVRRIAAAVTLPVTADLEDGYGLAPEDEFTDAKLQQFLFKTRRGRTYRGVFVVVDNEVRILRIRGPGQPPLEADELE